MLGRGVTTNANPGIPNGINVTDRILAVETGGHTSMLVKKCEDFFGYVGHRIRGSMGDGTANTTNEASYTFATAVVFICGATNVDVAISGTPTLSGSGLYCNYSSIDLTPDPLGGTYSLTGPASLNGNILSFTGSGNTNVTVQYSIPIPGCGGSVSTQIDFQTEDCNIAPTAVHDEVTTNQGVSVVISVPSNDTDSDGTINNSSVTINTNPTNGTVSVNTSTGQVTYTPNSGFNRTTSGK